MRAVQGDLLISNFSRIQNVLCSVFFLFRYLPAAKAVNVFREVDGVLGAPVVNAPLGCSASSSPLGVPAPPVVSLVGFSFASATEHRDELDFLDL